MPSFSELKHWSLAETLAFHADVPIHEIVIDTRKINRPEQAIFIAIPTPHRNGIAFLKDAYDKGIRSFLVQEKTDISSLPESNILLVPDVVSALQQIATAYRKKFSIPVVGITGSNGKTIVKEWLFQLLHDRQNVLRSPMSYNSQLGVPLSVMLLQPEYQLALFEAGISQPGEMEKLERIIHPSIGIFTNIGEAHSEGFMNQRQKILEKLLLFRHTKTLIYCRDFPELNECIVQYCHQIKNADETGLQRFTWSARTDADLKITATNSSTGNTTIEGIYLGKNQCISIPFTDAASIENAIHCWCACLVLNLPEHDIIEGMKTLQPIAMRMELRQGSNDCTIINDAYNSDLTSLLAALDYLSLQKQHAHRTVILSDMLQMGQSDASLYEHVAKLLERRGIQRFIGVGKALHKYRSFFRDNKNLKSIFFKTTEELLQKFHLLSFKNETILLKGARRFEFEKLAKLLEKKVHQTVLTINLSALDHNLNVYRNRLKNGTRIMAMVKAFGYGSGSFEIAHLLQNAGVDYLSVAYTDEGVELRKAGISLPIMVMSPEVASFDRMIAWKLEPELYNLRSVRLFTEMATTLKTVDYPVHLKLDTGMHRLGFEEDEMQELGALLQESSTLKVRSIFSHLAASEDPALDDFTKQQGLRFEKMSAALMQLLPYKPLRHLCNTAAIARHPELHFDMVRLGLGLYGIDGSGIIQKKLQQISTLRTTIAQLKTVKAGETIGYGRKGIAKHDMRIATISIGYADGYPRAIGDNNGHVLIHGKQAPLAATVCMDMCMVDVTSIANVAEGDEAIIFSPELPISKLAEWAGTIPYELMTGISQRVKRVYVNEG